MGALGTVWLVAGAVAIACVALLARRARRRKAWRMPSAQLRAFFLDPANFAARSVRSLGQAVGSWHDHYPLDHGLSVYVWRRADLVVAVATRGDSIEHVSMAELHTRDPAPRRIWSVEAAPQA